MAKTIIAHGPLYRANSGPKGISAFIPGKGNAGTSPAASARRRWAAPLPTRWSSFSEDVSASPASQSSVGQGRRRLQDRHDRARQRAHHDRRRRRGDLAAVQRSKSRLSTRGTREQFGKPIAEFQGVSFILADMATCGSRPRVTLGAKCRLAQRRGQLPFTTEAAMAKLFATDMAMDVTTDAVQVLGGSGYTPGLPGRALHAGSQGAADRRRYEPDPARRHGAVCSSCRASTPSSS